MQGSGGIDPSSIETFHVCGLVASKNRGEEPDAGDIQLIEAEQKIEAYERAKDRVEGALTKSPTP